MPYNDILDDAPKELSYSGAKVYTKQKIFIGTMLAGPLVGGYMMAANYKVLGMSQKVVPTWILTILGVLAIIGVAVYLPMADSIPNIVFSLPAAFAFAEVYKRDQEEKIEEMLAQGAEEYSGWRVAAIVGVIFILIIGLVVGALLVMDGWDEAPIEPMPIESEVAPAIETFSYGDAGHTIAYATDELSSLQVDEIGDAIVDEGYLEPPAKSMFLEMQGNAYVLYIADPIADPQSAETSRRYTRLSKGLETTMNAKVTVVLVDENFEISLAEF